MENFKCIGMIFPFDKCREFDLEQFDSVSACFTVGVRERRHSTPCITLSRLHNPNKITIRRGSRPSSPDLFKIKDIRLFDLSFNHTILLSK